MTQLTELNQSELHVPSVAEHDPMLQQGGVDVWGILARRKWLVILGLIVGLGLGYIYLLQASPVYESVAQVLIEQKKPPTIPISGFDTQFASVSEEAKHAVIIKTPRILAQAFDDFKLEKLPTFRDSDQPLVDLAENLSVEIVEEGTHVLNISFRGPHPDDTQKVVDAVLTTYEKFLQETYKDTGRETRDLIVRAKDELLDKWERLEKDYREFKSTSPLIYRGDDAINMHQDRQADFEAERVGLQKKLAELTARINSVQQALQSENGLEAVLMLAERDGMSPEQDNSSYREALQRDRYLQLLMQEEELLNRYGPDHPDVVTVRRQLEKYREMFPDLAEGKAMRRSQDELVEFVTSYLSSLKQQQLQLRDQYRALDELFSQEEEAAQQLQSYQAQDEQFRNEITRTQQLFEVVVKSLEEVSLVSDYQGHTYNVLAAPGIGEKVAPLPLKTLPISAILGLMGGFGIAYLVDIADKAFRTPDEVGQVMRTPVIGHIPLIDISKQKLLPNCEIAPVVCTVHRPKSPQSESYRAIRTALYFTNRDKNHRIIQVTSPMPGDGKSTLAANLASTIAQSGKRVLLLDADFRRPTLHTVFAFDPPEAGLASVVSGGADYQDGLYQVPQLPNLHIMACGPRPHNPSELLSSEEFGNVLEMLREQFDYVIVDTPPILAVSDPCAVAARVDGVLLTFRIHKRARPLAVRARDALVNVGANVLGVVVNGVDHEAGGYYSQYRYGYTGYRYAYNYRYGAYGTEAAETKAIKKYFDVEEGSTGINESESPASSPS